MFEKYTKKTFDLLKKQHNILVLVGNGFDVALLKKHNVGKMKGKTSSYIDFYEYIRYYNFSDENNILFKQMTRDREEHRNDWSDFELTIKRLVERPDISVSEIERCVYEFQTYFTRFLNDLVDADVLLEINKDSKDKKLAIQSFERFLRDLPDNSSLEFPSKTGHYDLYNFMFFNFNYTALLDNYIYLDKGQFDPHEWTSADRHFTFYPEFVESSTPTRWSSYLVTNIETLEEQSYNEQGEIWISSPTAMLGYDNNEEETKRVVYTDANGVKWIRSGDIGHMDEQGFLYIDGRIKRIIIRHDGFKVFPTQIENVIATCPEVKTCCAIGRADKDHSQGKLPVVYITLSREKKDKMKLKEELNSLCKQMLPEYMQPIDFVFIDKMPLTANGKVDFHELEGIELSNRL